MKKDKVISLALVAVSAILFFSSLAHYAFPGESAHLMAVWQGLDVDSSVGHPLMAPLAKLFGAGNLIAPILGVIAVMLVFSLTTSFVKFFVTPDENFSIGRVRRLSILAGVTASLVFMLTPSVRSAATHLEPRLFDGVWALAAFALFIPYFKSSRGAKFFPPILGGFLAIGFTNGGISLAIVPLVVFAMVILELKSKRKIYLPLLFFGLSFLFVLLVAMKVLGTNMTQVLGAAATELRSYAKASGTAFVAVSTILPLILLAFSARTSFKGKLSLTTFLFHVGLTIVSILAIATPLSASELAASRGVLPVLTSAYAAIAAGYLVAFWWHRRSNAINLAVGIVFVFVLLFNGLLDLFSFDSSRGAFADELARRVIAELGERTWFVTDGQLDDHLLLVAKEEGKELNLIALQRDTDERYREVLTERIREKNVGGAKNEELTLSLKLGVLPFVQDWFASDPSIGSEVAVFGASDLLYAAGMKSIPEKLFFGTDMKNFADQESFVALMEELCAILEAPKGWGSYFGGKNPEKEYDPVDLKRFSLRRHLGLLANNRGVMLQDMGRDDEAFRLYELVLNMIDNDNVCALFNEVEMANKHEKAKSKTRELQSRLKAILDDQNRRYILLRLGSYYGYIRNPDMFVKMGFAWARSGRPGSALAQLRRAIDFVSVENRNPLLNMMAALYASENQQQQSRKIYEAILAKDQTNHEALIGMMRLKLLEGDAASATEYLERAVKLSPQEGERAKIELAMVALMKKDLAGAKALLTEVTRENGKNMQAWSFLAAVAIQEYDQEKDAAEKNKILRDIELRIIPEMEHNANNSLDYYVQSAKAFVLLRKGADKLKEARAAFEIAARANPSSSVAQDLVMGLDIQLNDETSAEHHARDVLRRNRNAPLANYIMGSLALGKNNYREAEAFLRKAAEAPQPNVLALNDLAEVLRRLNRAPEAEEVIRRALNLAPEFYILHETLGVVLLAQDKNLDEAEAEIRKALELSKNVNAGFEDMRVYASLARVCLARGDMKSARSAVRRVEAKIDLLTAFERQEFEELKKRVQ